MRTIRERFNAVMRWQKVKQVPNMDFGYWSETIDVWHKQGLPENINTGADIERFLGLEGVESLPWTPTINGLYPPFEHKIIEDKGETQIIQDRNRNICEVSKKNSSIPKYIKYGIETRDDWEIFKNEHLDYKQPDRIGDVRKAADEARKAGLPIRFDAGSLYGWLRNWMGLENISIAIMTDREWVEEMMEHLTQMTLYIIEEALSGVEVDSAWWWEDMCYNHGPLCSPEAFEELMVPRYKRITDALKKHGVNVNILDCDGQIYELVPGWIEGGINCMFPIEAAHTDPFVLRKKYGRKLLLFGGVNKVKIAQGGKAIDNEMEKLRPLVEDGGYIPCFDHRVPPDVSLDNYKYYLEKKSEILNL